MGRPKCTQSCVVLPRSIAGLIVGKGGWRLREIEKTFHLHVCYVAKQGATQYVVCEGSALDVQAAKASIKHAIAHALSTPWSQRVSLYVYQYDGPSLPSAVQLHQINTSTLQSTCKTSSARCFTATMVACTDIATKLGSCDAPAIVGAGGKAVTFANELRATQPYVHTLFARLQKTTTDVRIGAVLGKNFMVSSSHRCATVSTAEWASLHATTQDYFNRYMLHTGRAHAVRLWAMEQGYVHTQVTLHALQYRQFADAPSYKTLFSKRSKIPKLSSASFPVLKVATPGATGKHTAGFASTISVIASTSAKMDFQLTFRAKPAATTATYKSKAPRAAGKATAKSKPWQQSRPEKVLFQIVERWSNGDVTISIEQKPSSTMTPSPATDLWAVHVAPSSAAIAAMCSSRDAFAAGVYSLEALAKVLVAIVG